MSIGGLFATNLAHGHDAMMNDGLPRFFGILYGKHARCSVDFAQLTDLTTAFSIKWRAIKNDDAFHAFIQGFSRFAVLIKIDKKVISTDTQVILRSLKSYILEKNGREVLHDIMPTFDNIMVTCPFHKEGKERKPSCGISTKDKRVNGKEIPIFTSSQVMNDIIGVEHDVIDIPDKVQRALELMQRIKLSSDDRML